MLLFWKIPLLFPIVELSQFTTEGTPSHQNRVKFRVNRIDENMYYITIIKGKEYTMNF